ncbi:MAG: Asp-tRNA(Asn)/Glu-tRNA(Gln) amidotransferase subunit GatC [Kiritimatiellae bacterium]|nr:Asp-tRNA(Asn)/Glu-tRNA(Gln) amidotransferase subunit GatC [Kiritimatiellia bacterium]
MANDKIDVRYVAHLARLHLTDDEVKAFQGQLEQIVGYVQKINNLDLADIEPTSHAHPVNNVFREDRVELGLKLEDVLENAPAVTGDLLMVPRIME